MCDDDGGVQWWQQQGQSEQWEAERRAMKESELLEAHREWVRIFKSGSVITNVKNLDNVEN